MGAVDLLQDAAAGQVGVHTAGDQELRHRVREGGGDAREGIGRSRSDRDAAGGDRPGGAIEPVGHVRGALLVHGRQHTDLVAGLDERVEERRVAVPRNAEHVRDTLVDEVLSDCLSSGVLHFRDSDSLRWFGDFVWPSIDA